MAKQPHAEPPEWRKLSKAQRKLLSTCILDGPHTVVPKTQRTLLVLTREKLVERVGGPFPRMLRHCITHIPLGRVYRASGKAHELWREIQKRKRYGVGGTVPA